MLRKVGPLDRLAVYVLSYLPVCFLGFSIQDVAWSALFSAVPVGIQLISERWNGFTCVQPPAHRATTTVLTTNGSGFRLHVSADLATTKQRYDEAVEMLLIGPYRLENSSENIGYLSLSNPSGSDLAQSGWRLGFLERLKIGGAEDDQISAILKAVQQTQNTIVHQS